MLFFTFLAGFLCFFCVVAYADFWRQVLDVSRRHNAPVLPYLSNLPSTLQQSVAEKNYAFERFVVKKFNKERFNCFYWRGDVHSEQLDPLINSYPNLEFDYMDEVSTISISLICRWNGSFEDDLIEWTSHELIDRYKNYERETKRAVFVIFGVGGTPEAPGEIFVAPLSKIPRHYEKISREFLSLYKKPDVHAEFLLNKHSMRLS